MLRRLDNGSNMDISSDTVDPMGIGIFARCSWWLNPYIAGYCYHLDTAQNHRRAYTFIIASKVNMSNNVPILFFLKTKWGNYLVGT
jgi:hypothetical protein